MQKNFMNAVQVKRNNSNRFDLSYTNTLTCKMGVLIPVMWKEAAPGDKWHIENEALVRLAPMTGVPMSRLDCYFYTFFVANRTTWRGTGRQSRWEMFITSTPDELTGAIPVHPYFLATAANATTGSLLDYAGVPPNTDIGATEKVNAFSLAAYQKIWSDYFRDQNLQEESIWDLVDGVNNTALNVLQNACWERDLFTGALPDAQKGSPVEIPLGTFNNVPVYKDQTTGGSEVQWSVMGEADPGDIPMTLTIPVVEQTTGPFDGLLYAETSSLTAGATNINDLRVAFRLQEYYEMLMRGGSRYSEFLQMFFGIRPQDARLQRAEYIVGSKTPVSISEVLQTSASDDAATPQGNMAGHGISYNRGNHGSYFVMEHGIIMTVMCIKPKPVYGQGLKKELTRDDSTDPTDYLTPQMAHLGETEVSNREVYAWQGAPGSEGFGYMPRYYEYRASNNEVAGEFRPGKSLDFWTFVRKFDDPPALNEDFVKCVPTTQPFAVTDPDNHNCWVSVLNVLNVSRQLPIFGTPSGV